MQRPFQQTTPLDRRLDEEAKRLRDEARGTPPGIERERLHWCMFRALQLGAASGTCQNPRFLGAASKPSAASHLNRPTHFGRTP